MGIPPCLPVPRSSSLTLVRSGGRTVSRLRGSMRSPREKQREARLLLIVAALAGDDGAQAVDVFALDFLLQHPSLLALYLRGTRADLSASVAPGVTETESSEEALLRWKRSVGGRTLAPMIGRLIARGLIR